MTASEPPQLIALDDQLVLRGVRATMAEEVLRALAGLLERHGDVRPSYADAIVAREPVFPTGLPTEIPVAIPHTDIEHCLRPALAVATLAEPVAFGEMGSESATVAARVVVALSITEAHAQVVWLQRLIELFQQGDLMRQMLAADSAASLTRLVRRGLGLERGA